MGKAVFLTDVIRAIFERRGKRVVGRKGNFSFLAEPLHEDNKKLTLSIFSIPYFERKDTETGWLVHDIETGDTWTLDEYIEGYADLSHEEYEEFDEARYQELLRDAEMNILPHLPSEEMPDGRIEQDDRLLPLAMLIWERFLQAEPGRRNYSLAANLAVEILESGEFPRWAFDGTRRERKELAMRYLGEVKSQAERMRSRWTNDEDGQEQ